MIQFDKLSNSHEHHNHKKLDSSVFKRDTLEHNYSIEQHNKLKMINMIENHE